MADGHERMSGDSAGGDDPDRTAASPLYFGYGSNLDAEDWERWCQARGLDPAGIRPVSPAILPDFQLAFDVFSRSRGGGVLDVVPCVGHGVDGILFEVSARGLAALDRKEGAPHFYRRHRCTAIVENGAAVAAFTYVVGDGLRQGLVPPADAYLGVCRRGRERCGLDTACLESAAAGGLPPSPIRGIFVYGTLLAGGCRAASLTGVVSPAATTGTLVDLGSFPALIPGGEGRVEGEYVVPEDLTGTLRRLDTIEGAAPDCATGGFYRRTILPVEVGGARHMAWAYVQDEAQAITLPRITSGSWRKR